MKIKKFIADNFAGALLMARREFGENAVVLSSDEKKGPEPFVEVTAAVDYEMEEFSASGPAQACDAPICPPEAPSGEEIKIPANGPGEPIGQEIAGELRSEIDGLKAAIREMRSAGREMAGHEVVGRRRNALFLYLRERRIREEFAVRLCEKARDEKDLLPLIVSDMKASAASSPPWPTGEDGKRAVMLIGPTGVGKTTTIAKLAARAVQRGRRAAIINLDTYRIGAGEQARIYARIMGIPLATACGPEEFKRHLSSFARTRDEIFIDTTGRNPADASHIEYIREMLQAAAGGSFSFPAPEIHLIMSASSDDEFMTSAYSSYNRLPIDRISFTKVDEAVRLGAIYNIQMVYGKPVAYVCTGQKVPGDLEFPDEDMLGNLILSKGCPQC